MIFSDFHNKMWKILKEIGIPDHLTFLLRNLYTGQEAIVRTRHEQQTGPQKEKEYIKAVYCHPAYLTYMQSTSWEMLGWRKHKLESRLLGEICRWHHPYGKKWRGTQKPLDESERGEWKSWLKAQHLENKDHGIWSHHFMANRWGHSETVADFILGGLQNHCRWWLQPWN